MKKSFYTRFTYAIIIAAILTSIFTACSAGLKKPIKPIKHGNTSNHYIIKDTGNMYKHPADVSETFAVNPPNKTYPPVKKLAYLTFDDGPSQETTPQILNTLNKYNIKATFFVIGENVVKYPYLVDLEVQEGFTVANHTYSHNIDYLYSNPKNLLDDFKKNEDLLKSTVSGYSSKLVRFPGGSQQRSRSYIKAVSDAGYKIIDWNCLSKDAENPNYTMNDLVQNIKITSKNKSNLIILMHDSDGKANTIQALPVIIEYFQSQGYDFQILQ